MYLRRLTVKNFRGIAFQSLELETGLNVIAGPNESGKSSLREALRHAFLSPSSPRGKSAVSAVRPWGSKAKPEVLVEFHHEGQDWVLKRVFFGKGSELLQDGRVVAREDEVLTFLEKRLANLAVLWSSQGEDKLAQVPSGLQPELAAAEAVTPGISAFGDRLDALYDEYWSEKREDPRKPLLNARDDFHSALTRKRDLKEKLESLNLNSQKIEQLDRQLLVEQEKCTALEQRLEQIRELVAGWESHRTALAETGRLEGELKAEESWLQQWTRTAEEIETQKQAAARYRETLQSLDSEIGPEPDQAVARALGARLNYARGLVQEKLCQELAELRPPAPEQLAELEQLLRQVETAEEAQGRVQEAVQLQIAIADQQAQYDKLKADQATLAAEVQTARQQLDRAEQARLQRLDELRRGIERWKDWREKFLTLWGELKRYQDKLKAGEPGTAPSQELVQSLKSRQANLEARRQQLLREKLEALKAPDPDQIARLRNLAQREARRPEAEREELEIEEIERQMDEVTREIPELARKVEELSSAANRSQDLERQAADLDKLRERIEKERQPIEQTLEALRTYDERMSRLDGSREPDRAPVNALKGRLREAEIRLQRLRQAELDRLRVADPTQLSKLEELDRLVDSPRGSRIVPLVAVGLGLTVLGVVLGLVGGFKIGPSVGIGLGVGLAAALISFGLGLGARSVPARLLQERESWLTSLGVKNLVEARENLTRATMLKARLRPELNQEEPATQALAHLDDAGLEAELAALPRQIDEAEAIWNQGQASYAAGRAERESLLKQSPEEKLSTQVRFLRSLAEDLEVPDTPGASWWDETLARMAGRAQSLRTGSAASAGEELSAAIRARDEKQTALVRLQGTAESRRKLYAERSAELPEPGALRACLEELGVATLEEAEARQETARQLKALLTESSGEATEFQSLGLEQVTDELVRLPDRLREAEAAFEHGLKSYEEQQQGLLLLAAENPEPQVPVLLEQLRSLAGDYPELKLSVPERADDAWIEVLRGEVEPGQETLAQLSSAGQSPDLQRQQELAAHEKVVEAAGSELEKSKGALESQRREIARLEPSLSGSLDLSQAEKLCLGYRKKRDELLASLGVESLEQGREREARAQALRAQLEAEGLAPEELAALRVQVDQPEQLESLPVTQLQQEVRALPERIEEANRAWGQAHKLWLGKREAREEHREENPEKLLAASLEHLRELASGRFEVPEEVTRAWAEGAVSSRRLELAERSADLDARKTRLKAPELPEDQARSQVGHLESQLEQVRALIKRLGTELGEDQGKLNTQSDLFSQLARAEEACAKAEEHLGKVEDEAGALKMLRTKLDEAKKDLENDLVGPLRQRIGERLLQITRGRYQELRLEQDFKAEVVLRADRVEAPISDLSFGTREQLAFLSRLCLAEMLSQDERHALMFDDNLVHTDEERLQIACQLLREVADKAQIVLLTCHPERYEAILSSAKVQRLTTLAR